MEAAWHDVGDIGELRGSSGRIQVKVTSKDRWVIVVGGEGEQLHCVDATCYHMGGPLLLADIEDFMGVKVSIQSRC